jgi:hypothetical protein
VLDLFLGVDSDGDGLPDFWEQLLVDGDFTGNLLDITDVDPLGDLDNDGMTNLQEFMLGTYALGAGDAPGRDVWSRSALTARKCASAASAVAATASRSAPTW